MSKDTLTIRDNRTGRNMRFPFKTEDSVNGSAPDQISEDDFGLMGSDPAFMNTASCQSKIIFVA
jgi:citrate synthase